MNSSKRRNPKAYDGTRTTTHELKAILPDLLRHVGGLFSNSSDKIVLFWGELMGPHLAPYAKAETFAGGVLRVKVKNHTLYALLTQQEKPKLLKRMREAFPSVQIKTIEFRIG